MSKWIKRAIIGLILCLVWSLVETSLVTIKHYEVSQPKLKGLKIVFLSDFHYSNTSGMGKIERIVKKTNQLEPDLVILGGDYTNDDLNYVDPLFEALSQIKTKMGIYVISGNHDYSPGNQAEISKMITKYKMIDLNNTSYWIDYGQSRFKLGGIADMTHQKPQPEKVLHDTLQSDFVILASHQPDYIMSIDEELSQSIDLMLSGHSHGGQITLFGLYAPYIPSNYGQKFRTGLVAIRETDVIVSNGLGESLIPLRFFSPSQIVLITVV